MLSYILHIISFFFFFFSFSCPLSFDVAQLCFKRSVWLTKRSCLFDQRQRLVVRYSVGGHQVIDAHTRRPRDTLSAVHENFVVGRRRKRAGNELVRRSAVLSDILASTILESVQINACEAIFRTESATIQRSTGCDARLQR